MTTTPESDSPAYDPPSAARLLDSGPPTERRLPLAGTQNVRDVGGLRADGGRIRPRTLLRGDALHKLDDDGRALLADIGLRTVIDLREPIEYEAAPDALDGLDVRVVHQSVLGRPRGDRPLRLADLYEAKVEQSGPNLATVIRVLAEPGALPAIVHCTGGKDRTGLVVALVLSVLGVSEQDIIEDYALTSRYLDLTKLDNVRNMTAAQHTDTSLKDLGASPPELMRSTLDLIHTRHGGPVAYLRGHGVTDADFAALRAGLVEPADA